MLEYLILLIFAIYLLSLYLGFVLLFFNTSPRNHHYSEIAVLVIARNEEKNIGFLLQDLYLQTVQPGRIYFFDDHSDDGTIDIALSFLEKFNGKLILERGLPIYGKKDVLEYALKKIPEEWVITVDADCRLKPTWLASIAGQMDNDVRMIASPVLMQHESNIWARWVYTEHAIVMAAGYIFAGLRFPLYVSGANMLFRKQDMLRYFEVKNQLLPYGDDVFFMQYLLKKHGQKTICFSTDPDSIVLTRSPHNLREWFLQRIRWLTKSKAYELKYPLWIGMLLFLVEFTPWIYLIFNFSFSLLLLIVKSLLQTLLLAFIQKKWKQPFYCCLAWISFIFYFWLLWLYAIITLFFDVKEWKGRSFQK